MHARITTYKMRPEAVDEAMKKLESVRDQILSMPGTIQFINSIDAEGNGVVISVLESEEHVAGNQAKVAEIWQHFTEYLTEAPVPGSYEVKANWKA